MDNEGYKYLRVKDIKENDEYKHISAGKNMWSKCGNKVINFKDNPYYYNNYYLFRRKISKKLKIG